MYLVLPICVFLLADVRVMALSLAQLWQIRVWLLHEKIRALKFTLKVDCKEMGNRGFTEE